MKKVLAITCVLVALTLLAAAMASAVDTQANWRIYIKAADTAGLNSGGDCQLGVYSSSKDGYGADGVASDSQDTRAALTQAPARSVVGVFDNKAWIKDIKSNRVPLDPYYSSFGGVKPWYLRVAGLGTASTLDTVLTIRLVSVAAGLPPQTFPWSGQNIPAQYFLKMVDNRSIAGAPANGTVWKINMPTTWQSTAFFSLTLPTFNISVPNNEAALISEGYKLEFYQTPEPSSLMALGAGLMGIGGFFTRRRKK